MQDDQTKLLASLDRRVKGTLEDKVKVVVTDRGAIWLDGTGARVLEAEDTGTPEQSHDHRDERCAKDRRQHGDCDAGGEGFDGLRREKHPSRQRVALSQDEASSLIYYQASS